MNYKDIEKEFKQKYPTSYSKMDINQKIDLAFFLDTEINQVIDDMIGKERNKPTFNKEEIWKEKGYNQKVSELKEYKVKFNK